jgi:choline dehydrogenase-like flavoprotein
MRAGTELVDVAVVGSGATGGWVAKRLTEAGVRVTMLEAGRPASDADYREHVQAYELRYHGMSKAPLARERPRQSESYACDEWNAPFYADDRAEPYTTPAGQFFPWVGRIRLLGGRTNVWGRQSYRFSDLDFKAASRDGVGIDWPVGYADLAPYYDTVERYIGVSGQVEGYPYLPDGQYQPAMPMTCPERALRERVKSKFGRLVTIGRSANLTAPLNGRAQCHYCGPVRARLHDALLLQLGIHHRRRCQAHGEADACHRRDGAPRRHGPRHAARRRRRVRGPRPAARCARSGRATSSCARRHSNRPASC